ncbi:hypothetical protein C8J56DRAFT_775674, partial [Mycena floridula]
VIQVYNEIGDVCRDRGHIGRLQGWYSYWSIQMMLALLEHSSDIFLDEIQVQLEEQHSLELFLSTIYRTLKWLGITNKKVSQRLNHASRLAIQDFSLAITEYPPSYLVCADESAVNILTTYHLNGWS